MAESRNPWPFRVLGAVIALGIALWFTVLFDWGDESAPSTATEAAPRPEPIDAGVPEPAPERRVAPAPAFDPHELRMVLYDGGMPDEVPAYDPEPIVVPPTRNTEPVTPERALARAVFWRGLLQRRIDQTSAQLQAARASGDTGRARNLERMIERLEAQQPALAQRITELEAAAPPRDEEEAGGEPPDEPDQGEY